MDKYEYRHLWEEIQNLMTQGSYADAASLADRIDWRRVKNTATLEKVGELYKINRRYEDARDILLFAYDRKQDNKQICYSLCEIYCKLGDLTEANEYYKEYEKLAPRDYRRYILKYKLYCAADTSIDERIEVLERLKEESPQEKWIYELAKLYDKRGLATKCAEVCDELVLWFGEGKYVNMALELKRLHEPLTEKQQAIYDNRFQQNEVAYAGQYQQNEAAYNEQYQQNNQANFYGEAGYDSYTAQTGFAYEEHAGQEESAYTENNHFDNGENDPSKFADQAENIGNTRMFDANEVRRQMKHQEEQHLEPSQLTNTVTLPEDDMDIQIKTVDVGRFNTMNLQAELAKGMQEMLEAEGDSLKEQFPAESEVDHTNARLGEQAYHEDADVADGQEDLRQENSQVRKDQAESVEDMINKQVMNEMRTDRLYADNVNPLVKQAMNAQPPETMAQVLTQESDGQIRLVMPERKHLEKQITGQMSIEDIRAEWEQIKQRNKEKHEEELRQQVQRHTGQMFTEFEMKIRDSILAKMEGGENEFSQRFQDNPVRGKASEEPEMFDWDQGNTKKIVEDKPKNDFFEMESLGEMNYSDMLFDNNGSETDETEESGTVENAAEENFAEETTAEENAVEENVAEFTTDEENAVEENVAEETTAEENAAEENVAEFTTAEENAAEENVAEETAAEENAVEENVAEETTAEENVAEETTAEENAAEENVAEETTAEEKAVEENVAEETTAEENTAEENAAVEKHSEEEVQKERIVEESEKVEERFVKEVVGEAKEKVTDFYWEEEDNWGEESDFEFGFEKEQKSDSDDKTEERQEVTEERELPDDGNIEFESLPQEEEYEAGDDFAYETELESQETGAGNGFDEKDAVEGEEEAEGVSPEEDGDGIDYEGFSADETDLEDTENEEESAEKIPVRELSKEEESIYGSLLQGQVSREQLARAIDAINMASYVGNVVITGEADVNTLELAKRMVKEIKAIDSNFVGSAIKMNGKTFNTRDVAKQILDLKNGALIIDKPNQMTEETIEILYNMLQREDLGIVVFLLDSRKGINGFFKKHENLRPMFTAHVHVKPISEEALASYARKYAYENEFSIDSMGMLALHTRIDEMQTAQHAVTYEDVKEIMDDAMDSAAAISLGHFFDILFGKRYDEEDMIVITEKDFR